MKQRYGHHLHFCAHLELIDGFTKQRDYIDAYAVCTFAVVFLYAMPSEVEAFCCLEKFVKMCPACNASTGDFHREMQVGYPFYYTRVISKDSQSPYCIFYSDALNTSTLTSLPV